MALDPAQAAAEAQQQQVAPPNYNPKGEGNGMFVPPHIAGYQPSADAVSAWSKENHPITPGMVDELRMPAAYGSGGGDGSISFGNKGQIDPEILRLSSGQAGKYDVQGRRDAIAARLLANEQAASAAAATPAASPFDQSAFDANYWRMRNYEINSMNGGNY